MREAAAWLADRLAGERDRFFRIGPAPLAPRPDRRLAPQEAGQLAELMRALAVAPPAVSLSHMALRFPPVGQFLERFRAVLRRRRRFDFDAEVHGLSRVEQAVAFLALLELRKSGELELDAGRAVRPDKGSPFRPRKDCSVDRPLRLISTNPVDQLARTIEALLVIASAPLSVDELVDATDDDSERVETALGLLGDRYREGRCGIVLEHVAGGWAFRAAREAAEACARLVERPVERGLSHAALETLAVVAYLGPCSRPEIARIRGVAADSAVASLVERGLIAEAGRDAGIGGAVRYRTTPLFERVFGLDSLAALPRLEDLGDDTEAIRERLVAVAEARAS